MSFPFLAADAVTETYRHLLSGQRDAINLLSQDVATDDDTIELADDINNVQPGSLLSIDLETLYVRTTSASSRSAKVIRGWLGSQQSAHLADAPVYVNPRFSGWDIFQALNVELADLSSPSVGMYAIGETEIAYNPVRRGYDLGVPRDEVQSVLEIRYQTKDSTFAWPRVKKYEVLWDTNLTDFPSGTAIRLDEMLWPGAPFRVKYSRPFLPLVDLTTDLVTTCLLPSTAIDIPPLGAAAMLMFHKEAKRSFLESQGDTRRAAEVPPGSSMRAASALLSLRNRRANDEANRISNNYPNYIAR